MALDENYLGNKNIRIVFVQIFNYTLLYFRPDKVHKHCFLGQIKNSWKSAPIFAKICVFNCLKPGCAHTNTGTTTNILT